MIDYLFAVPNADIPAPLPPQTVYAADDGGTITAYLVGPGGFAEWDAMLTAYIVGAWDRDQEATDGYLQAGQTFNGSTVEGTPTHPLQPDYLAYIRPMGNKDRSATGDLDSIRWQGHPEAKWLQDDDRYLDTDDPFVLTITRDDNTYPAWDSGTTYDNGVKVMHAGTSWASQQVNNLNHEPGAPGSGPWWLATEFGWGWTATMIEPAVSQDPITGYNIRAYPTPECVPGDQLYTSGNFSNGGGNAFTTSAPSGNWTATEEQVNIALIFVGGGNTQNGIITMEVGQDEVTGQFWSHDQV
jgi:hypothetical protein